MTGVTVDLAAPVQVSSLAPTVGYGVTVDLADPVLVFGLPVVVGEPAPAASPTPDAVKAKVYNSAGTFVANLPRADGIRWLDEHNSAGGATIDTHRYDDVETAHPGIWAAGNQVVISVGSKDVFRVVLDGEPGYRIDEAGQRVDSWAGTGALGILNSGEVEPEYGWRDEATDERSFDYGSNPAIGGWYVASEWKKPVGKLVRQSYRWTHKKHHYPKKWPEKKAQWLWWKSPDSTSTPDEVCYFIDTFTLSQARRVKFWVCGDDALEFQVDGEVRITAGPGSWKKASTLVMTLAAGTHTVAAKVTNAPSSQGAANRAGFLCAIGRLNSDGDVAAWILRSNPTTWKVRRQRSAAPGWYPGQILWQVVTEEIAAGCAGHNLISLGFSTKVDSHGSAWTGSRLERSLTVGTQGLEYVQKMVEAGIDVSMTPALRLNAWRQRGADRSSFVRINQGTSRVLDESASPEASRRNDLRARAKTGWVGRTATSSIAAIGRRKAVVSMGASRSKAQTAAMLAAMINDLAYPPQTLEVKLSGAASGPQPYRDFDVADWVSYKPAGRTTWVRYRVMSIGGEVNPAGYPDWTIQLYEDA
jgi:hypothetical protein